MGRVDADAGYISQVLHRCAAPERAVPLTADMRTAPAGGDTPPGR